MPRARYVFCEQHEMTSSSSKSVIPHFYSREIYNFFMLQILRMFLLAENKLDTILTVLTLGKNTLAAFI